MENMSKSLNLSNSTQPAIELTIAGFLFIPKYDILKLYSSFILF